MKYLSILLLVLIAFASNAQDTLTFKEKIKSLKENLEKRKAKIDSLKLPSLPDSLKPKTPSLDSVGKGSQLPTAKLDSLPKLDASKYTDKISAKQDSLTKKISAPVNSLAEGVNEKATNLHNKIQANSDSV